MARRELGCCRRLGLIKIAAIPMLRSPPALAPEQDLSTTMVYFTQAQAHFLLNKVALSVQYIFETAPHCLSGNLSALPPGPRWVDAAGWQVLNFHMEFSVSPIAVWIDAIGACCHCLAGAVSC